MTAQNKVLARLALAALLTLPLAGCGFSLIDKEPAPKIFDISAPQLEGQQGAALSWQLIVEDPEALRSFGTNRIALKRANNSIEYYHGVRWSDRGPALIRARLIETLENSGRLMSVGSQTSGINANWRLKSHLRDFHADLSGGGAPLVTVTLSANLFSVETGDVVAGRIITKTVKAQSSRMSAVIAAFDDATADVISQTTVWILEEGERRG